MHSYVHEMCSRKGPDAAGGVVATFSGKLAYKENYSVGISERLNSQLVCLQREVIAIDGDTRHASKICSMCASMATRGMTAAHRSVVSFEAV